MLIYKTTSRISVTTLIGLYKQKFDGAFWSAYKACEEITKSLGESTGTDGGFSLIKGKLLDTKRWDPKYLTELNIDEEEFNTVRSNILLKYETEKNEACERGTAIHAEFENSFYQSKETELQRFGLGGKFKCNKNHIKLDDERRVLPEYLISYRSPDGELRIAGQIDLLIKDGNEITIVDWKTNKKIETTSYYDKKKKSKQMMYAPLDNIQDTNYWHYCLQLSLYAYLLQQYNPKFEIKMLKIVHVDHSGRETEYECPYLKDDVIKMLKHYKKTTRINNQKDLDKTIVF